jgi:putative transposase
VWITLAGGRFFCRACKKSEGHRISFRERNLFTAGCRPPRSGEKRWPSRTKLGQVRPQLKVQCPLEPRIPKDREGRFQPTLFGRYQRSEKALLLALVEMYIQGVSTRKVSRVVEELCGFSVSASQVSALTKKLDVELHAWRERSLADVAYPYLVIDAHSEKVRRDGRIRSVAVLRVVGIREDGYREHLGVWLGITESSETWGRVFQELLGRGLRGVHYLVSDEHRGLREALLRSFPGAAQQRCQVHYLRNLLAQCSSPERFGQVKDELRDLWDSPTREIADQKLKMLLERLDEKQPKVARWLEESIEGTPKGRVSTAPGFGSDTPFDPTPPEENYRKFCTWSEAERLPRNIAGTSAPVSPQPSPCSC